jgi:hypothetical protein
MAMVMNMVMNMVMVTDMGTVTNMDTPNMYVL